IGGPNAADTEAAHPTDTARASAAPHPAHVPLPEGLPASLPRRCIVMLNLPRFIPRLTGLGLLASGTFLASENARKGTHKGTKGANPWTQGRPGNKLHLFRLRSSPRRRARIAARPAVGCTPATLKMQPHALVLAGEPVNRRKGRRVG